MKILYLLLSIIIFVLVATGCAVVGEYNHSSLAVSLFDPLRLDDFLAEGSESAGVKKEALATQLNTPWSFSIEVSAPGEKSHTVDSCRNYFAVDDQAEPVRPSEYPAYRVVGISCLAVQQALSMQASDKSFVRSITCDKTLADKFPDEVALVISSEEKKRLNENPDIRVWSDVEEIISVDQLDTDVYHYKTEGVNHNIKRLALGDVNDDGLEDLLIRDDVTLDEGSYSASRLFVLTRRSAQGTLEVLNSF